MTATIAQQAKLAQTTDRLLEAVFAERKLLRKINEDTDRIEAELNLGLKPFGGTLGQLKFIADRAVEIDNAKTELAEASEAYYNIRNVIAYADADTESGRTNAEDSQ